MLEKDDLQLSGISSDTSEDSDRLRVGYIRKPNGQLYRVSYCTPPALFGFLDIYVS